MRVRLPSLTPASSPFDPELRHYPRAHRPEGGRRVRTAETPVRLRLGPPPRARSSADLGASVRSSQHGVRLAGGSPSALASPTSQAAARPHEPQLARFEPSRRHHDPHRGRAELGDHLGPIHRVRWVRFPGRGPSAPVAQPGRGNGLRHRPVPVRIRLGAPPSCGSPTLVEARSREGRQRGFESRPQDHPVASPNGRGSGPRSRLMRVRVRRDDHRPCSPTGRDGGLKPRALLVRIEPRAPCSSTQPSERSA